MARYETLYYGIELALRDNQKLVIGNTRPNEDFEVSIEPTESTNRSLIIQEKGSDLSDLLLNVSNQYLIQKKIEAEDLPHEIDSNIHKPPIWFPFHFYRMLGKVQVQKTPRGHGYGSQVEPPFREGKNFYEVLCFACKYMHEWQ